MQKDWNPIWKSNIRSELYDFSLKFYPFRFVRPTSSMINHFKFILSEVKNHYIKYKLPSHIKVILYSIYHYLWKFSGPSHNMGQKCKKIEKRNDSKTKLLNWVSEIFYIGILVKTYQFLPLEPSIQNRDKVSVFHYCGK